MSYVVRINMVNGTNYGCVSKINNVNVDDIIGEQYQSYSDLLDKVVFKITDTTNKPFVYIKDDNKGHFEINTAHICAVELAPKMGR